MKQGETHKRLTWCPGSQDRTWPSTGSGSSFHILQNSSIFFKFCNSLYKNVSKSLNMLKYSLILTIVNLFHIPTKTDGQTRRSSTYSPDPPQALKLSRKGVEVPCVQVQQSAHLEQCSKVANERCFEKSTAGVKTDKQLSQFCLIPADKVSLQLTG